MLDAVDDTQGDRDQSPPAPRRPGGPRFPLTFLTDVRLPKEADDLVRGLLPGRSLSVLYGKPGSGKSFVALDMALHVAAGRPWAGRTVKQAGVIYVAAEGGRGLHRRLIAAMRHHGLSPNLPFALVTVAPSLGRQSEDAAQLAREIQEQIPRGFTPGLVVLDTLARSMAGGDESGSTGMGLFIDNAESLGKALKSTVMPVHHMGKDPAQGMRGSSALLGAVDAAWEIDTEVPGLLKLVKMKDDQDGLHVPFALERVELGQYADGAPITSCVARVGDAIQPHAVTKVARDKAVLYASAQPTANLAFAGALRLLMGALGRAAPGRYKRLPKGVPVLKQVELLAHASELGIAGSSEKSRQSQIDRHILTLDRARIVSRHDGWLWFVDAADLTKNEEKFPAG